MAVRILLSCALSAAVFTTSAEVALAQRHGGGHGHSHGGHGHSHGGHGHSHGHYHGGGGGHYHGGGGHYHGGYGGYRPYYGLGYIGIGLGYGGWGGRYYGSGYYYGNGYYGSGYYGSGGYYGSAPVYYDSSYGGAYAVATSEGSSSPGYNPPPPQAGGGVIEIASLADTGATLKYALDEFPYDIEPGQVQRVSYDRPWVIEFHRGGSNGVARYSLVPGRYKFIGTDQGWDLVSVAARPAVTGDAESGSVTELPPPTPVTPKRPVPTPPTPMPPAPNE